MPGTGSYTGTNVNSNYISYVGDALYELRDNSSQLIKPQDVRDSVWTLWNRIDDIQILASQSLVGSSGTTYTNSNPTTIAVGGIAIGTTFSGTYSVQQMFDKLLYPYTAPTLTLTPNPTPRQFGSSTAVTLTWYVTKTKETITGITVAGSSITPITGNTQGGTKTTTATHSLVPTAVQEIQTYSMSVVDASLTTTTKTATVVWQHKIYWGSISLSSLSNPNLTTSPSSSAAVGGYITDLMIRSLSGASVSPGNSLATSYAKTYTGINGAGNYLIFAHPTIFGSSPSFVVNNNPNTAFTKVRSSSFVNESGFSISYDVWVSNTAYNGAANIIIS